MLNRYILKYLQQSVMPINIKSLWIPIVVFMCVMIAKIFARGGIDLKTYQMIALTNPLEWGNYYLRNFISWITIYVSFSMTEGKSIGLSLVVLDLILWGMFFIMTRKDTHLNRSLAPLAMFSVAGILLSYNILRQYIALMIFLILYMRLLNRNSVTTGLFSLAALLSHFSSIFLIAALYFSKIQFKSKSRYFITMTLSIALYFSLIIIFRNSIIGSFGVLDDHVIEFYAFLMLSVSMYFLFHLKANFCMHKNTGFKKIIASKRFLSCLLIMIIGLFIAGLPVWVLNRLLISFMFLTIVFVFTFKRTRRSLQSQLVDYFATLSCFLTSLISLIVHPGARNMLGL